MCLATKSEIFSNTKYFLCRISIFFCFTVKHTKFAYLWNIEHCQQSFFLFFFHHSLKLNKARLTYISYSPLFFFLILTYFENFITTSNAKAELFFMSFSFITHAHSWPYFCFKHITQSRVFHFKPSVPGNIFPWNNFRCLKSHKCLACFESNSISHELLRSLS